METEDKLFTKPLDKIVDWTFDQNVANVFPNMVKRSIPGYAVIIDTIGTLAKRFVTPHSTVYDLGCSLGAATLSVRNNIDVDDVHIIAVDNSEAMVERCIAQISQFKANQVKIDVLCDDALKLSISNASMVILNFTLQFINPTQRTDLLANIYNGMNDGGLLVLSEKIKSDDAQIDDLLIDLHYDFKRANGYSQLEISQKRSMLENVMRLETIDDHHNRLKAIGFKQVSKWYQCFNFVSFIALK